MQYSLYMRHVCHAGIYTILYGPLWPGHIIWITFCDLIFYRLYDMEYVLEHIIPMGYGHTYGQRAILYGPYNIT